MRAFIINLDAATDRWKFIENSFAHSKLIRCRVPAIEAGTLTFPNECYAERQYRCFHGRMTNPCELACYLSHLKAMEAFLATDDPYGLIAEDDLVLHPEFDTLIEMALQHSRFWNILRVAGLRHGRPLKVVKLQAGYSLCVNLGRLKGSGAYLIDRTAAETLRAHLLPMRLPFDHAIDREWFWGLRAAQIVPFPVSQTESDFLSSVQPGIYPKLSRVRRYFTTYPYQAFNEMARGAFRTSQYFRFRLAALRSAW
jgi:glycosyl transferase, family 25